MTRIGRNVDFNVSFDTFINKYLDWLPTRPTVGSTPDPTITKLSTGSQKPINLDIYGEALDLTDLKTHIETQFPSVIFVINGNAINPEPIPDVEDPPTQDELDAAAFFKTAFNAEFDSMIADIFSAIETRYNAINTTPIAYADVSKPDIKHLRQRA